MWEKGGNFYGLHRSIQGTHHVFFQRFLQSRHTLCRHQRMARQEQAAAKRNSIKQRLISALFRFRFDEQAT